MPRGVYPRTANQLAAAKLNLAQGHSRAARAKAIAVLRRLAQDPAWRQKVASQTTKAMHRPDIRRRHLQALKDAPVNFRGGNGQPMTGALRQAVALFQARGFAPETIVKTRGHQTTHRPPSHYKLDLANVTLKLAFELDGPVHRPRAKQQVDQRKQDVLASLGWTVVRIKHPLTDELSEACCLLMNQAWERRSKRLASSTPSPASDTSSSCVRPR
jgi:hypothetical protein